MERKNKNLDYRLDLIYIFIFIDIKIYEKKIMERFPIDEKIKKKIIAVISALIPEAKIYLYGSRARGTHGEWSDIDLALDAEKPLNKLDVGEVRDVMVELNIPYKVDVVDIHNISDQLKKEILRDKIIWKP
jgi:predicted nucleotidyltransferase